MMKPKIVLIGTVLLFGNPVFAVEVDRAVFGQLSETVRYDHSVETIVEALCAKGLEKATARSKAEALFSADKAVSSRRIDTLAAAFPELPPETITGYLAECALHGKKVDLGSYDALVGMMQSITKRALDEKGYERVRRVAEANSGNGAAPAA